jgi:hypothetical protein
MDERTVTAMDSCPAGPVDSVRAGAGRTAAPRDPSHGYPRGDSPVLRTDIYLSRPLTSNHVGLGRTTELVRQTAPMTPLSEAAFELENFSASGAKRSSSPRCFPLGTGRAFQTPPSSLEEAGCFSSTPNRRPPRGRDWERNGDCTSRRPVSSTLAALLLRRRGAVPISFTVPEVKGQPEIMDAFRKLPRPAGVFHCRRRPSIRVRHPFPCALSHASTSASMRMASDFLFTGCRPRFSGAFSE